MDMLFDTFLRLLFSFGLKHVRLERARDFIFV